MTALKTELAGIEAQLNGLRASGQAAFSPETSGLEAKQAQVSAAIEGTKTKLEELKAKAGEVGGTAAEVKVSAPGAAEVINQLQQIINLAGQAGTAVANVGSAGGGGIKGRAGGSSPKFSDGVTPGAGAH